MLELEKYKNHPKKDRVEYVIRFDETIVEKLDVCAKANGNVKRSIVLRYIVDWSCDRLESDEEYRNHMVALSFKLNDKGQKKPINCSLNKEVNERMESLRMKFHISNRSYFIHESIRLFFESHGSNILS